MIVIRVDSSIDIGSGHVMRCLTLAMALREKGLQILFICSDLPGNISHLIEQQKFVLYRLPCGIQGTPLAVAINWQTDAQQVCNILQQIESVELLVIDHYDIDKQWELMVQPYVNRIMVIDDLANREHECDILLDQDFHFDLGERYNHLLPQHCLKLLGPEFVMIRNEFLEFNTNKIRTDVKRILIYMGGGDQNDDTTKVLNACLDLNRTDIEIDLVVGESNPHQKKLQKMASQKQSLHYYYKINNFAEIMHRADLSIGGGGGTLWERCYLGLPSIVIGIAENQYKVSQVCGEIGVVQYLGSRNQVTQKQITFAIADMMANPSQLEVMSSKAKSLVDGKGCVRVLQQIDNLISLS